MHIQYIGDSMYLYSMQLAEKETKVFTKEHQQDTEIAPLEWF